jgi:hypothetical protein
MVEHFDGDLDMVRGRPLQKFSAIEAVLAANVLCRQPPLFNPANYSRFGRIKKLAHLPKGQLHCCSPLFTQLASRLRLSVRFRER